MYIEIELYENLNGQEHNFKEDIVLQQSIVLKRSPETQPLT